IEFHYSSDIGAGPLGTGESASIGIRNVTGGENNFIDAITGSRILTSGCNTTDQYPRFGIRFTPGSIMAPIAGGTYTVGSGGTWTSLTEAIAQMNHRGISGAITLNLTDATYSPAASEGGNIFPLVIGPITSATNTLTIQSSSPTVYRNINAPGCPNGGGSGVFRAISTTATTLSSGAQEGTFHLAGADYVTIQRIHFGLPSASQNDLSRAVVITNASTTDGATNNLIQNVNVTLSRDNTSTFAFDMRVPYTPASAAGANSNNKFYNYNISNVYSGITLTGNATFPDLNTELGTTSCTTFNTIGSTTLGDIGGSTTAVFGIQVVSGQQNIKIFNNIIRNLTNSPTATSSVTGLSALGLMGTSEIYNNHVYQLTSLNTISTTPVVTGITATASGTGAHTVRIYNNMVGGLINAYTGAASAVRNVIGLSVGNANASATYQVHFNSVRVENTNTSSNTAFQLLSNTSVHNIRNNIFTNFTGAQSGLAVHYAMAVPFTTLGGAGSVSNNNVLYVDNATNGHYGLENTTNRTTFANWQSAFGGVDAASVAGNPQFASGTDLHLAGSLASGVANMTGITWVTTDFDCGTRTAPHWAGADQAENCSGTPTLGTLTAFPTTPCVGSLVALQVASAPFGLGLTYNWELSTDGGATWSSFSTTPPPITYTATGLPTQFRLTATCSFSGLSHTSNVASITPITNICQCDIYPSVFASSTADEDIGSVTVGSFTNSSTCATTAPGPGSIQNRYSNYTTLSGPSASQGDVVSFSVDVITCGTGTFGNGVQIYVDWNQDGDFLDAGEQVYNQPVAASGAHTKSGTFTVPMSAATGSTRMRVVVVETTFPTTTNYAHTTYTWGETEDYCFTVNPAGACSGTPAPGTTTASTTVGCTGSPVTLNFTGTLTGTGLSYNWEASTDGGTTWTTFSNSAPPVTYTFGTSTTQFRCTVTCSNGGQSGTSTPVTVTAGGTCQCTSYPAVYASSPIDEEITNVTVGTMNNSSTCATLAPGPGSIQNQYSNYTTSVSGPSADQGASVSFSLTQTTCNGNYGNGFQIYVDWNQDGDFLDAGEQVYSQPATAIGNHTQTGSFTVPMTATPGTTRMRVVNVETTFPTTVNYAHTAYTWGETEDYCFTVNMPPPCTGTPNPGNTTASVSSACNGQSVNLAFTGTVSGSGLSYQWQFSTNGGVTWTNFGPNAPTATYTFGTQTTQFRCTVTCSNGGQSGTSTPVTVTAGSACQCASYCTASLHLFASDCITNVSIHTLNNTTAGTCALPSYSLQTATTTLQRGNTYTFSMTNAGFGAIASVWFDWNNNLTFEPGEHYQPY
ncbi:MAG: GEVED domain-containing protein, partial [Flavobacteriales bacterium]|nr:GEVED domain-containing protein [Flavobacteriales bacterium]